MLTRGGRSQGSLLNTGMYFAFWLLQFFHPLLYSGGAEAVSRQGNEWLLPWASALVARAGLNVHQQH